MKVLVAFASRHGATQGIAERIASTLSAAGHDAAALPLRPMNSPPDAPKLVSAPERGMSGGAPPRRSARRDGPAPCLFSRRASRRAIMSSPISTTRCGESRRSRQRGGAGEGLTRGGFGPPS